MTMISGGLLLALMGVLSAPGVVPFKSTQMKVALGMVTPFQSLVGVGGIVSGLSGLLSAVLNLGLATRATLLWASCVGASLLLVLLGLVLGAGTLRPFLGNHKARLASLLDGVAPHQRRLGTVAIGLGLWTAVLSLLWPSR